MTNSSSTVRVLHAADLQLGVAQYGLPQRQQDFDNTCRTILAEAVRNKVDAVVLAGDIFDVQRPPSQSVRALAEGVEACRAAGIPVFGIEGNHDVTPNADWLRTCGVIPIGGAKRAIGRVGTAVMGGLNYTPPKQFMDALSAYLNEHPDVSVLVIHQTLAELCGFSGSPLTTAEMARVLGPTRVRTVLLGDIHNYAEVVVDGIRFCQPGAPEITSSSDHWPRSANLLTIDENGVTVDSQQIILPVRQFKFVRVTSEDEMQALAALTREDTTGLKPLYYIRYLPTLPDAKKRIASMLPKDALHVCMPTSLNGIDIDDSASSESLQKYERHGAKAALSSMLSEPPFSLAPESDDYQLITALMARPDELQFILDQFCIGNNVPVKRRAQ